MSVINCNIINLIVSLEERCGIQRSFLAERIFLVQTLLQLLKQKFLINTETI